jgi:hypothetical protein
MGYGKEAQMELLEIPWAIVYDSLKKRTPLQPAMRSLPRIATVEYMAMESAARQASSPSNGAMY